MKAECTSTEDDYLPCFCDSPFEQTHLFISCIEKEVSDIMDVFNRTPTKQLQEIYMEKNVKDYFFPDSLISDKQTNHLIFYCLHSDTKIAKDAFNSTRQYTTEVALYNCPLHEPGLSFIDGFTKLKNLNINNFYEMGRVFSTFPINLPSISYLKLIQCIGWNSLVNAPSPIIGAKNFTRLDITQSGDMDDGIMNVVMVWAVASFNSSIKSLYISSNNLTRIPPQIEFFEQMKTLDISSNFFPLIQSGSLKFKSGALSLIDLSSCGVKEIEPNAFQGKKKYD